MHTRIYIKNFDVCEKKKRKNLKLLMFNNLGRKVGAVVRALTSHQGGLGSNPAPDVICGSPWLVFAMLRGFFSGFSDFPPSTKTSTSKFIFDLETEDEEPLHRMCHSVQIPILFIYLFIANEPAERLRRQRIVPREVWRMRKKSRSSSESVTVRCKM